MRRRRLAMLMVIGWVGGGIGGSLLAAPVGASCIAAAIAVGKNVLIRGEPFEITGRAFGTDCNDTGGPGPVLGVRQTHTTIAFVQAGRVTRMFSVDVDADYSFRVRTVLPPSAGPGAGSLRVVATRPHEAAASIQPLRVWVRGNTARINSPVPVPTFLGGTRPGTTAGEVSHARSHWFVWALGLAAVVAVGAFALSRRSPAAD